MPLQSLTTPPDTPARTDTPEDFIVKADAFVAWFETFVGEMQTLTAQLEASAALIAAAPAYADPLLKVIADSNLTPAADKGVYLSSSSVAALFSLTSFGRTLNGLADAAALRTAGSLYSIAQVDSAIAAAVTGLLEFKGSTDCSANPNYPAASKGDAYVVTVAGKIGGASGKSVEVGDVYVASADNAGGTEAGVGTNWFVLEHNLAGALLSGNALSELAGVAATARSNIGAQAALAHSSNSDGHCISVAIGGTTYKLQWGTKASITGNTNVSVTFPETFGSAPTVVGGGGHNGTSDPDQIRVVNATITTTGFDLNNSDASTMTGHWFAIGVG